MRLLWTADEMTEATGGTMRAPFAATGVCIDSRALQRGDLFIALEGDARDGHDFVADALARGAAGALIHRDIPGLPANAPILCVDDTLAALTRLGGYARARFTGKLVAVTGSVGKTTTKEMLRAILAAHGPTHAAEASFNNHWGVPTTLARLPADAAWCVVEIGMNHAGEIKPLAKLARPHVALITTVERTHIGHLGSIEAIADEKISVARGLEAGGVIVLPADSPLLGRMRDAVSGKRVVTFGASMDADSRLLDAQADADGTSLDVDIAGRRLATRLAAPGLHMAMDALAALTAATALGADPAVGARALAGFTPVAGRGAGVARALRWCGSGQGRASARTPGGGGYFLRWENGAAPERAFCAWRLHAWDRLHLFRRHHGVLRTRSRLAGGGGRGEGVHHSVHRAKRARRAA